MSILNSFPFQVLFSLMLCIDIKHKKEFIINELIIHLIDFSSIFLKSIISVFKMKKLYAYVSAPVLHTERRARSTHGHFY